MEWYSRVIDYSAEQGRRAFLLWQRIKIIYRPFFQLAAVQSLITCTATVMYYSLHRIPSRRL